MDPNPGFEANVNSFGSLALGSFFGFTSRLPILLPETFRISSRFLLFVDAEGAAGSGLLVILVLILAVSSSLESWAF